MHFQLHRPWCTTVIKLSFSKSATFFLEGSNIELALSTFMQITTEFSKHSEFSYAPYIPSLQIVTEVINNNPVVPVTQMTKASKLVQKNPKISQKSSK